MKKKYSFRFVDVFTDSAFSGNQLAVFEKPKNLTKKQMQNIAREINFSETTFVYPSKRKEIDAKVRIFTPYSEIPFAGHPVIGTAFVLAEKFNKRRKKKAQRIFLEIESGVVELDVAYHGKNPPTITMHQPVPKFGVALMDRGQAAKAVGIERESVIGGGVVSNGLDFLIVELDSEDSVKRARLNIDQAARVIERYHVSGIYIFSREEGSRIDLHSRFFAPTLGVQEDPATGSASGAVGGYLSRIFKFPAKLEIRILQGAEIGRPSKIDVTVLCERGVVSAVSVTGTVVPAGEGYLIVP